MRKNKIAPGLVTKSLEHISKEIFSRHATLITQLIERSSGVYALYDEGELYYVGRATQLRKRVRQHLKDRHDASWTHFSLYLVSDDSHIGEIESLLVRIANPKGNAVKPKGRDSRTLHKELENLIKQKHKEELGNLFSRTVKKPKLSSADGRTLKGMVVKRTPIYRTYKGKEHKAMLTPAGSIIYNGKKYETPTSAARVVVKGRVNGWRFWYIKNEADEWVKLAYYNV
jgi:hypothetical protein